MSQTLSTTLTIQNERGLHARAAANFVKTIAGLEADVEVERLGQTVDGNSIMGLMMLAASKGTTITVKASGKDAQTALKNITNLVNSKFGEDK